MTIDDLSTMADSIGDLGIELDWKIVEEIKKTRDLSPMSEEFYKIRIKVDKYDELLSFITDVHIGLMRVIERMKALEE